MKVAARNAPSPRIGFVSLGCPKALVDSERILSELRGDGYEFVPTYADADLVVVNTCGFIEAAREESLQAIGEALAENGRVIVTGCLGVDEATIRARHPKVLGVTGPHQYQRVVSAVREHLPPPPRHDPFIDLVPPQGIRLTPRHYAYLKVSEGCNHRCSFCIIPSLRGKLSSRPIDDVMREAETLVEAGVSELLVISQDTSAYGADLKYAPADWRGRRLSARFADLCAALGELGVWVRLHYVYPYPHVDEVIPMMADGRIVPYLDVPFQHASPRILKLMRRPAAAEDTLRRVAAWRRHCPDLAIRSTFIVGFPGETDADFEVLLQFLGQAQLDRVGCFRYSPVAGAAANALPDPVPEALQAERFERLMQLQEGISAARLRRRVGRTIEVLVDEIRGDDAVGRSHADAPDIDGRVIVRGGAASRPGARVQVRIEASAEHDLYGVPAA
jgi:ribosomal protein S12 methylthiotransferase